MQMPGGTHFTYFVEWSNKAMQMPGGTHFTYFVEWSNKAMQMPGGIPTSPIKRTSVRFCKQKIAICSQEFKFLDA
jgi:hypothetical protein